MKELFENIELKKSHVIIFIFGLMWVGLLYFYIENTFESDERIEKLKSQIETQKKEIKKYQEFYSELDSIYKIKHNQIDSIQTLRDENNSNDFAYSSDSIKSIWTDRFGHD